MKESEKKFDVTLLTETRFVNIPNDDSYGKIILEEDEVLRKALEKRGLKVHRTNWDDKNFDWSTTRTVMLRATWDYFRRIGEFNKWLDDTSKVTMFVNTIGTIHWNIDKHYLLDLEKAGIKIPPTVFVEAGDKRPLSEIANSAGWKNFILKPAISGGAWHTYKVNSEDVNTHEEIFRELIAKESMLLQEYQYRIETKGEIALVVFGGKYSFAVHKSAMKGEFRVQEEFGGTISDYTPTADEIAFAEKMAKFINPVPEYARVDVIWDNYDNLCVSELELIEPGLWFRKNPSAAEMLAEVIKTNIERK